MQTIIYHNPRCTKSRATLALLIAHGIEPEIVEYLNDPPAVATLRRLLSALKMTAHAIVRSQEAPYTELNLAAADEATVLAAITQHPILLERPIVLRGNRAAIGRPPENILPLLAD
ncbi:MAG: arsenate reductase (glutaredoxin) [Gammaproteobacteria bacterium]|nr:arsenate reductase (glutaredoxin) [Gammaproteobacteria bacterium]